MSAEPNAAYDDLNIGTITVVGIVAAILVFVAIVSVQVIYYRFEKAQFTQKVLDTSLASSDALSRQHARLAVAGVGAEADKGEKSVPIDDAMRGVLAEYQGRQSKSKTARRQPPATRADSDTEDRDVRTKE